MRTNEYIRVIAGAFVAISIALGYFVSPYWFLFTLFVGLNLMQSGITKWCLLEIILVKLGVKKSEANYKVN